MAFSFSSLTETIVKGNARIKFYPTPNGGFIPWDCTIFAHDVYKRNGFELHDPEERQHVKRARSDTPDDDSRRKSFSRAKNNLFDLLMSNSDIGYFVTLTFDEQKIDRYDYTAVVRKLGQWLDNNVRRKNLRYILVPEFHKDGAVHFHGFINCDVLDLCEAVNPYTGKLIKHRGKRVFNISSYKLGYSTAIPIKPDEIDATRKYVFKYITKTGGEKVGGRYYLSGGDLLRPVWRIADIDFRIEFDEQKYNTSSHTLPDLGYEYKKLQFEGDLDKLVDFLRIVNHAN
jgi:hypothetical protein